MQNHLKLLSFCNIRRLNPFRTYEEKILGEWAKQRTWYQFGTVNVFVGANGAGKSTVLELVDLIREPQRVTTLARENQNRHSVTAFHLVFQRGDDVLVAIHPYKREGKSMASNVGSKTNLVDIQALELNVRTAGGQNHDIDRNISKIELDATSQADIAQALGAVGAEVCYFDPQAAITGAELVGELNAARTHLRGILSQVEMMDAGAAQPLLSASGEDIGREGLKVIQEKPFILLDDGRLAVYLSDDIEQFNHVQPAAIPAGWRQLSAVLAWLRNCPQGAICLIEEPETHLHPRLQRYLALAMAAIARDQQLQLLIATHSPVFQQPSVWPDGANVFEARAGVLSTMTDAWHVLDDLGIKGSDVSQSNGVIWIEGPSDRLYIKHWLDVYCRQHGLTPPVENRDYAFCMYGGASLSHFTVSELDVFIDMVCINRNLAIVMDRDKDFAPGTNHCVNPSSAKCRVIGELGRRDLPKSQLWITDGYTVESYLPDVFRSQYFDEKDGRLVLKENKNKVDAARKYVKNFPDWSGCCHAPELLAHIETLLNLICSWDL